ncbi:hypothetical protein RND81_03G147900 [Saponaria officinalis]|uniref:PGG domain-containing protein n=1 Tax=Saponaria officinalis TaxID=3572 RepID=A0AAW1MAW4_SAPOF
MEIQTQRIESLVTNLYDAALEGNVPSLLALLQEDPLILERYSLKKSFDFTQTPLHVAVNLGHLDFSREILGRKPELAEELDFSKRWSPLHVASAKGYLEIVKILLVVNPDMCLVRDLDGRNPIHVAAIKGQVHVLDELVRVMAQAARERTNRGETVLHLCVKHGQSDALKYLVNVLADGVVLNSRNCDGNTVLHLAIDGKQLEVVSFLLTNKRTEINAINRNGLTPMDIFIQSRKDINDKALWRVLKREQAMTATEALEPPNQHQRRLDGQRNGLMVVASLIATMAFTIGVSPPGGAWQDNNNGHTAGTAIMADVSNGQFDTKLVFFMNHIGIGQYQLLLIVNTIGLISSLSVILLLISGLPCKRLFVGMLMMIMWIAVTATTMSYMIAVNFLASGKPDHTVWNAIEISLYVWLLLMILLLLGHALRFYIWLSKKLLAKERVWYGRVA